MEKLDSSVLVARETDESCKERELRIVAAGEVDMVVRAFGFKKPWEFPGPEPEPYQWPKDHETIFEEVASARDEDMEEDRIIMLLSSDHLGDARDLIPPLLDKWRSLGRKVLKSENEIEGFDVLSKFSEFSYWSFGPKETSTLVTIRTDEETSVIELEVYLDPFGSAAHNPQHGQEQADPDSER